jgi:hypothetical protein
LSLAAEIRQASGVRLDPTKTRVLTPKGTSPAEHTVRVLGSKWNPRIILLRSISISSTGSWLTPSGA